MSKLLFSYLKFWATGYLNRAKPEIVAVTGSVGKTSTKEVIFEVLKIKFGPEVRKSAGNLNNESGVPLAILGFKNVPSYGSKNPFGWIPIILAAPFRSFLMKKNKILILEMAADRPGDIKYLTSFIHPKVAVLTSIGPAHLEKFGNLEKIVEEKSDLLRSLGADGWAVLNLDDENVRKISYGGRFRKKTYAIQNKADIVAKNIQTEISDFIAQSKFIIASSSNNIEVSQNTLGTKWNVLASLAAAAVGEIYELSGKEIAEGLSNAKNEKHRMNVLAGKNGSTIIDDAYNANPLSMRAALDLLHHLNCKSRKIAVIGDMREIGPISDEAHHLIGQYAHEVADMVVAVGTEAKKYQAQQYFKTSEKAKEYLLKEIRPGDIILIKASRGSAQMPELEAIVEALKV